jgi:hypothetical protein
MSEGDGYVREVFHDGRLLEPVNHATGAGDLLAPLATYEDERNDSCIFRRYHIGIVIQVYSRECMCNRHNSLAAPKNWLPTRLSTRQCIYVASHFETVLMMYELGAWIYPHP